MLGGNGNRLIDERTFVMALLIGFTLLWIWEHWVSGPVAFPGAKSAAIVVGTSVVGGVLALALLTRFEHSIAAITVCVVASFGSLVLLGIELDLVRRLGTLVFIWTFVGGLLVLGLLDISTTSTA